MRLNRRLELLDSHVFLKHGWQHSALLSGQVEALLVLWADRFQLVIVEETDPLFEGHLLEHLGVIGHALVHLLSGLRRVHRVIQDSDVLPNDLVPLIRVGLSLEERFEVLKPDPSSQNQSIDTILTRLQRFRRHNQR